MADPTAGVTAYEVATPAGPARVHRSGPAGWPLLVLGHGAGGGVHAADLLAARSGAQEAGWSCALVEQPYRVQGRRAPEPATRLDEAWCAVVAALCAGAAPPRLAVGGRSSGARVACRTAAVTSADAVLCLAFPLVPPVRGGDRLPELRLPAVPRLVVQGVRDAFGMPVAEPGVEVHPVAGADHAFRVRRADGRTADQVAGDIRVAVASWLRLRTRG